jgi:hypothetical protein
MGGFRQICTMLAIADRYRHGHVSHHAPPLRHGIRTTPEEQCLGNSDRLYQILVFLFIVQIDDASGSGYWTRSIRHARRTLQSAALTSCHCLPGPFTIQQFHCSGGHLTIFCPCYVCCCLSNSTTLRLDGARFIGDLFPVISTCV